MSTPNAVADPSGAVNVELVIVEFGLFHAVKSSVFVSKFTRADRTGHLVPVAWDQWLPGISLTEMLSRVSVALLVMVSAYTNRLLVSFVRIRTWNNLFPSPAVTYTEYP